MGLESADGALCSVATVHVWWHQLVGGLPHLLNGALVLPACFVVQDLEVYFVAQCCNTTSDDIVSCGGMVRSWVGL